MKKEHEEKGLRVSAIVHGAIASLVAEGMTKANAATYLIVRGASELQEASSSDEVRKILRSIDTNIIDVFDSDDDDDKEGLQRNIIKLRQ